MSLVFPGYTATGATSDSDSKASPPEAVDEATKDTGDAAAPTKKSNDLSALGENGFKIKNETSYNPDLDVLFNSPAPIEKMDKLYERYEEDSPLVLILHTHACESYFDTNDSGTFRSLDPARTVVAVGDVLAATLERGGVKTVHLTEMFDTTSFNTAYDRSAAAVKKVLNEYPSIQYIFDVHRDSIKSADGDYISADFKYGDISCAQLMFVCGTDEAGSNHTGWRSNLTVALQLQSKLYSVSSTMMRPINLRTASFYQSFRFGSLLLEFGTSANSLREAKSTAVIYGSSLADYILGKSAGLDVNALITELCG